MEMHSSAEKTNQNERFLYRTLTYLNATWRYIKLQGHFPFHYAKIASLTLFVVYFAVPIFVKANQWILPKVVFSNLIYWPPFVNLSLPKDFGLDNARHFYLHVEDGIDIGAWHIPPRSSSVDEVSSSSVQNNEFDGDHSVFLYLHGNSGTRGSYHRVKLYKLLSQLGFHVVTIDYRGYGDSSGSPCENGVVQDAYFTYKWLKERVGDKNIYIWGHSLGTGITTKLSKILCDEGDPPAGVVLESPFSNIQDAATNHPFASPYRYLPYFEMVFVNGIGEHGIFFDSEKSIVSVTSPILILHAKDDFIVPFQLGQKLYKRAKESRNEATADVEFVSFESHRGYGHKLIYQAPELPQLIQTFTSKRSISPQTTKPLL